MNVAKSFFALLASGPNLHFDHSQQGHKCGIWSRRGEGNSTLKD